MLSGADHFPTFSSQFPHLFITFSHLGVHPGSAHRPDLGKGENAMKSLGLNNLSPFKPMEKIIEYAIKPLYGNLASQNIYSFCDILSSSSPAPGGGSVSALAGSLGSSLSAMVANLTFGKKKWHTRAAYGQGSVYRIFGYDFTIRKPRSLLFMILVVFIVLLVFFSR